MYLNGECLVRTSSVECRVKIVISLIQNLKWTIFRRLSSNIMQCQNTSFFFFFFLGGGGVTSILIKWISRNEIFSQIYLKYVNYWSHSHFLFRHQIADWMCLPNFCQQICEDFKVTWVSYAISLIWNPSQIFLTNWYGYKYVLLSHLQPWVAFNRNSDLSILWSLWKVSFLHNYDLS